jgi:hypothetical protein
MKVPMPQYWLCRDYDADALLNVPVPSYYESAYESADISILVVPS